MRPSMRGAHHAPAPVGRRKLRRGAANGDRRTRLSGIPRPYEHRYRNDNGGGYVVVRLTVMSTAINPLCWTVTAEHPLP
jgi:hypothetical protein